MDDNKDNKLLGLVAGFVYLKSVDIPTFFRP